MLTHVTTPVIVGGPIGGPFTKACFYSYFHLMRDWLLVLRLLVHEGPPAVVVDSLKREFPQEKSTRA